MQPVYLFNLASRQAEWLSIRQATVAENIVNAKTPGFRARDVEPFEATLDKTALKMASSDSGHLPLGDSPVSKSVVRRLQASEIGEHNNDVNLEHELMKSSEVTNDFALNVSIVKAFHRMWMTAVKG